MRFLVLYGSKNAVILKYSGKEKLIEEIEKHVTMCYIVIGDGIGHLNFACR